MVDKDGLVSTLIGSHTHKSHWKPIPCDGTLNTGEVHLRWPTDLSINPLDNTLHIIDDHMVLKLTTDNRLKVIAGRPIHCPPAARTGLNTDQELAVQTALVMPQSISFAPNGNMYVAESDSQRTNRIRVISKCSHILYVQPSVKKSYYLICIHTPTFFLSFGFFGRLGHPVSFSSRLCSPLNPSSLLRLLILLQLYYLPISNLVSPWAFFSTAFCSSTILSREFWPLISCPA